MERIRDTLQHDYGIAFISGEQGCHSHSRTLSPAVANNSDAAHTFRILAIGGGGEGIAFNLACRRPQETTNILFKHLTNTRCPGRARSTVCPVRNNSVALANNSETETPVEKEGKRPGGCLFCYYPSAQVRRAAYLGARSISLLQLFPPLFSSATLTLYRPFYYPTLRFSQCIAMRLHDRVLRNPSRRGMKIKI